MAVQDPQGTDGRPGSITFNPALSWAERKQLVEDMAAFDSGYCAILHKRESKG